MKSIYVGNLPYSASKEDIERLFSPFGEVHSVKLISDRGTGKPKGFGFVEMDDSSAKEAIEKLNENEFMGRKLRINEANPRK